MSVEKLPKSMAPFRLADEGRTLGGIVSLEGMERLPRFTSSNHAEVKVELEFCKDFENRAVIEGHLATQVELECQRCLQNFSHAIDANFTVVPIHNEAEEKLLPPHYAALLVTEEFINTQDLIEDEIILNLPLIAKHPEGMCEMNYKNIDENIDIENGKRNPFSNLANIISNEF